MDQMQNILNSYNNIGTTNPGDITGSLMNAVQGFAPQINQQRTMQAQAYATPANMFNQYNQNNGAVGGMSSMGRLSSVLGNIGQQQQSAGALGDIINMQGGNINQLSKNILDMMNARKGDYMNQFQMASDIAGKDLQAQQIAASRASAAGPAIDWGNLLGMLKSTDQPTNGGLSPELLQFINDNKINPMANSQTPFAIGKNLPYTVNPNIVSQLNSQFNPQSWGGNFFANQ